MTRASLLLEQLERAERSTTGPPPEVAERMWATIEQRLIQGPPPPELEPLTTEVGEVAEPAVTAVSTAGRHVLLKIVGGVTLVGLGAGLLALALDRDESVDRDPEPAAIVEPESPVAPIAPIAPIAPNTPILEPAGVSDIALEPILVPEPIVVPEPKPRKPSGTKPVVQKSLADELALMQAISTALAKGHSAKVLGLVADHRRDFPHGQFIEERNAAEARALCRNGKPTGKIQKGQLKAEQFTEEWPNSIHLASVRTDCDL